MSFVNITNVQSSVLYMVLYIHFPLPWYEAPLTCCSLGLCSREKLLLKMPPNLMFHPNGAPNNLVHWPLFLLANKVLCIIVHIISIHLSYNPPLHRDSKLIHCSVSSGSCGGTMINLLFTDSCSGAGAHRRRTRCSAQDEEPRITLG